MLSYKPFAEKFIACFACPILRLYLDQVELHVQGHEWMSRRLICHTIAFLEESIRPKETWAALRSHIPALLPRFIFPLLCISPEEVREFQEEPEDYARAQFGDFFEDLCTSPSTMAAQFILALGSGRKKTMFMSMLSFITDICAKYPSEANPREKDGALRMLAYLATVITETKSIRQNIEGCLISYVFPEFQSQHAFLRARTCEVIRKFENAGSEWTDPKIISAYYQGVMQCLSDSALPVRVQAALTLADISDHPQIHEALAPHIGGVMQGMLRLSNEVDLDSLTQATRCLVSGFSDELLPYAADLAQALHQSYMRLMSEIADTRQRLGDEDDDSSEEKVLVAMNILKTLQQLVVGLEGNPTVLMQVEAASIPLIEYTLKQELVEWLSTTFANNSPLEIYDEALELLDSIQFALKEISNAQWSLFDIIYNIFKTSGTDFISEMFPSLDNFVTYGSNFLASHAEKRNMIFDIYLATITSKNLSCSDRMVACKLADSILLCMKGNADEAIPLFIEHTMKIIQRGITTVDPITTKGLFMHSLEVILNTIYYNPSMAMNVLVKNNWSGDFFSGWFNRLSSFQRTHDKKLSLLAICSILSISLNESAESILVQSSAQLLIGALTLFETLPTAIRNRFELESDYNLDSDDSDDGNTTVDEGSEAEDGDDADDCDLVDPQIRAPSAYCHPQSAFGQAGGDDERTIPPSSLWSDEILWETPLDRIDVYKEFGLVMKNVENSGSPILHIISNALNAEQRLSLQKILHQAHHGGEIEMKSEIQQSIQVKNHLNDQAL
ncbi:armadillo-type protein [Melampsora americana]|nr:armadillo-type protein [Melampsora americana]